MKYIPGRINYGLGGEDWFTPVSDAVDTEAEAWDIADSFPQFSDTASAVEIEDEE